MSLERVALVRVGRGALAGNAARLVREPGWLDGAPVLKQQGAAWVRRARVGDVEIVVKCRPIASVRRRVQSLLGLGHAHRQWRGAQRLEAAGVRTGRPVFIARARLAGVPVELLALEFVPGETVLEVLDRVRRGVGPQVRVQHAIAHAAGELVTRMVRAGLFNRDHKASNIVACRGRSVEAAVIDCVGVRACTGAERTRAARAMLAAMMIEAIGCGCTPRRALWMRAIVAAEQGAGATRAERCANIRAVVADVAAIIAAHGDPTPRVNPLSAAGGAGAGG